MSDRLSNAQQIWCDMAICGLDFGTSNSTIGVIKQGRQTMVPLESDATGEVHTTLPSALFFGFEDTETDFGRRAIARYTAGESGRLMRSMKSVLGTSLMGEKTQVLGRFLSYDDIIGLVVARLRNSAEAFLGVESDTLDSVVMGRPVFFNDKHPERDREAQSHLGNIARLAGFKEVSFQFEPIAAALDYESRVTGEELALIVDIGGGTSDFTLIRLSPDRHRQSDRESDVLANYGVHIGGTDFDRNLSVKGVMSSFGLGVPLANKPSMEMPSYYYFDLATWHRIHLLYDRRITQELQEVKRDLSDKVPIQRLIELLKRRQGHQLAALVEQAKIRLSEADKATVPLDTLFSSDSDIGADVTTLTRKTLHEALEQDVSAIFVALDTALRQAGVRHSSIDTVFTTGGSTALPLIQTCITDAFPGARHVAGDLYNSVGAGLLTEARNRYG